MTICKSLSVRCPPERAFAIFTRDIGRWWPLQRGFSFYRARAHEIFLEDREGGRFYERFTDGTESEIGRVLRCEPPRLIVFSFRAPGWEAATEVEVRFAGEAGGTRVELEHRGFRTSPAMEQRGKGFAGGWDIVLAQFCETANQ